jgi:hypothetical protein
MFSMALGVGLLLCSFIYFDTIDCAQVGSSMKYEEENCPRAVSTEVYV